jgi:hypothetical protein
MLQGDCFNELISGLDGLFQCVLQVVKHLVHLVVLLSQFIGFKRFLTQLMSLLSELI